MDSSVSTAVEVREGQDVLQGTMQTPSMVPTNCPRLIVKYFGKSAVISEANGRELRRACLVIRGRAVKMDKDSLDRQVRPHVRESKDGCQEEDAEACASVLGLGVLVEHVVEGAVVKLDKVTLT